MNVRKKALAVHFLTATGAVFAMLAMLAATEAQLRDSTAELDRMRSGAGGARRNLALAPI